MKRAALALLAASLVAPVPGCGVALRQDLTGVEREIQEARAQGAYRCAPRELALAETHYEFSLEELAYGDYPRARREYDVAARNSRAALELSPRERCALAVTIVERPSPVTISKTDTDKDGVPDMDDKCVEVPGPIENGGCPHADTDKDGLIDKDDRCPSVAGPVENRGCPYLDADKDGLIDKDDRCPSEAGPADNGGCPPPDRDKDTVLDRNDRCPDDAGAPANDGCPYKLIIVTREKIELRQKVFFDTDRAVIKPASFAMLDEIADLLVRNSTLEVRIEGHTDARASLRRNIKLSQARAASVRQYLVSRGVDPTKMMAVGYGPNRPIDDNRTAVGRDANRRVEFVITKR